MAELGGSTGRGDEMMGPCHRGLMLLPYHQKFHVRLKGLSDEEFYTLVGSEEFENYSVDHIHACGECATRLHALDEKWKLRGVPILTAFQRELNRMEKEIASKELCLPDSALDDCVEHAFRIRSRSRRA